jgi:uncharacterized protein YrrD
VCDICLAENGEIEGILVKKGALIKKPWLIPLHAIASFGTDGIMLEDDVNFQPVKGSYHILDGREKLVGKPLLSAEGEKLGILQDVYFHEELGTILGYECSDGFFADITEGKRVFKSDAPPKIGKDAIIVNIQS